MDVSPSQPANRKARLWAGIAGRLTVFGASLSHAATLLCGWLQGADAGALSCDRAKMDWAHRRQSFWTPLNCVFQTLADSVNARAKRLGRVLLKATGERCASWAREGAVARRGWAPAMRPMRQRFDALLLGGAFGPSARSRGVCNAISAGCDRLRTFLVDDGIAPTIDAGEPALRRAVIWGKLCSSALRAAVARFAEALLRTIETSSQQQRNVIAFGVAAVQAYFIREPAPSLLSGA